MMTKKLTAIGNSYGIVIDRAILELLEITPETELELSTDGKRLVIEPKRTERRPRRPVQPPKPTLPGKARRPEPRYGFPKKQPW